MIIFIVISHPYLYFFQGYLLKFKPEFGSWDGVELQPYQESHTLRNLRCGTAYEMTISAINEVGKGEASELLVVSTDGGGMFTFQA